MNVITSYHGPDKLYTKVFVADEPGFNVTSKDHVCVHLPGVVSRKKQMLPTITDALQM